MSEPIKVKVVAMEGATTDAPRSPALREYIPTVLPSALDRAKKAYLALNEQGRTEFIRWLTHGANATNAGQAEPAPAKKTKQK